jgi:hypothetical protein
MPGFTAENSLYQTDRHYRMAGRASQADGVILPAAGCTLDELDLLFEVYDAVGGFGGDTIACYRYVAFQLCA